jgi:hypothetical protein
MDQVHRVASVCLGKGGDRAFRHIRSGEPDHASEPPRPNDASPQEIGAHSAPVTAPGGAKAATITRDDRRGRTDPGLLRGSAKARHHGEVAGVRRKGAGEGRAEGRQAGGDPDEKRFPCSGWVGQGRRRDRTLEAWGPQASGRKGGRGPPEVEVGARAGVGATGSGQGAAGRDQGWSSARKTA